VLQASLRAVHAKLLHGGLQLRVQLRLLLGQMSLQHRRVVRRWCRSWSWSWCWGWCWGWCRSWGWCWGWSWCRCWGWLRHALQAQLCDHLQDLGVPQVRLLEPATPDREPRLDGGTQPRIPVLVGFHGRQTIRGPTPVVVVVVVVIALFSGDEAADFSFDELAVEPGHEVAVDWLPLVDKPLENGCGGEIG